MSRGPVKTFGILGWLAVGLGALLTGAESNNHSVCNSALGALAEGLDKNAANQCAGDNLLYFAGIVGIFIGLVLLAGWVYLLVRRGNQQPQAPLPTAMPSATAQAGWYPQPGNDQALFRYWDGTAWSSEHYAHWDGKALRPAAPPPPMR